MPQISPTESGQSASQCIWLQLSITRELQTKSWFLVDISVLETIGKTCRNFQIPAFSKKCRYKPNRTGFLTSKLRNFPIVTHRMCSSGHLGCILTSKTTECWKVLVFGRGKGDWHPLKLSFSSRLLLWRSRVIDKSSKVINDKLCCRD